jgi:hypothetical protein
VLAFQAQGMPIAFSTRHKKPPGKQTGVRLMQPVIKMAGQEAKETIAPSFQLVSTVFSGYNETGYSESLVIP